MNRRTFLTASAAFSISMRRALSQQQTPAVHRLPPSDVHYRRTSTYVETNPVPQYRWASDAAYERFRDMKFGVRVHWGIYSILGLPNESWPYLRKSFVERMAYNQLYRTWNPTGFDADAWTNLFHDSGAKMFSFTTRHHDGFSMFDTKTRVRSRADWTAAGGPRIVPCDLAYSIMETPFRRDVTAELCAAARKRGLAIDLYYSHPDWYDADFRPYAYHPLQTAASLAADVDRVRERPAAEVYTEVRASSSAEVQRMMLRHRAQLMELLTHYGPIDMIGLDQWLGPAVWPKLRETLLQMRTLQPDVMLRARGIGNYGDYYTPERFVPSGKVNSDVPWFVIYPLGTSFSYEPDPKLYKGAAWIVHNLVDAVAKGGNFMVGVGPDGQGRFAPEAQRQLLETGRWLAVNGEGIYATRPRPSSLWREGESIRYTSTKDGRTVYAFSTEWPGNTLTLTSVRPSEGSVVQMLGYPKPLSWQHDTAGGTVIAIPEQLQSIANRPVGLAWGFKIAVAPQAPRAL